MLNVILRNSLRVKNMSKNILKNRTISSKSHILLENKYGASNYAPIPIVIRQALNTRVWDVDGKSYLDFLSAYGSVNQGHNHPRIIRAMHEQSKRLSITSRAFYNDKLGEYSKNDYKYVWLPTCTSDEHGSGKWRNST